MEDWAEVHRLAHREGLAKAAIARRLGMSRTTVDRLLGLTEPPRYERAPQGSQLDPFADRIASMLAGDPAVRATVIRERLRPLGYRGGITILKDHLARVRPEFLAAGPTSARATSPARSARSTGGTRGRWFRSAGATPGGLRSRGHAAALGRPRVRLHCPGRSLTSAPRWPLARAPGRRARRLVLDNDASVVASREGRRSRLHPEVSGLFGGLRATRSSSRRGGRPPRARWSGRSAISRRPSCRCAPSPTSRTCRPSTTPGPRRSPSPATSGVRLDRGRCLPVEKDYLGPLPEPLPDTDQHLETRTQGLPSCARRGLLGAARLLRPPRQLAAHALDHPLPPRAAPRGPPAQLRARRRGPRPGARPGAPAAREAKGRMAAVTSNCRRSISPAMTRSGGDGMSAASEGRLSLPGAQGSAHPPDRPARRAGPGRGLGLRGLPRRRAFRGGDGSGDHGGENRVRSARFPQVKTLDDFDFSFQRSVKREDIPHLAQLDFLREKKNIIFLGPPGTGKTHSPSPSPFRRPGAATGCTSRPRRSG